MKLAELTWPDVAALDPNGTVLMTPYAACEQHGPHLPFYTDTFLVTAVAEGVERRVPDSVLLAPTQWLGASAHHLPFPGTFSADLDTHIRMITDPLTPFLERGWQKLFVLNGHGGNIDTYHVALRRLQERFPEADLIGASYWEVAGKEIAARLKGPRKDVGHACEAETALMLAVRPDLVRQDRAQDDERVLPGALAGAFQPASMKRRTGQGVVGFPTLATREQGQDMLEAIADRVAEVVRSLVDDGARWA